MDKDNLTPEESFNIIIKAVTNFKMNYKENGNSFLLWGWVLTLACFSHFIILRILHSKEAYDHIQLFSLGNWIIFSLIAFIIQYFMERKINKDKKVYSYLDSYIKKLWMVSAIAMFVAVILCFKLEIVPPVLILLITGIATTITGLLIRFKPLIIGGIAFFFFSVSATFVSEENTLLITAAAIICGYLVPGYMLKSAKEQ